MKRILYILPIILIIVACSDVDDKASPDMALYELRGNVRQCIVEVSDSIVHLYSDTLMFSPSGNLIKETAFSYIYDDVDRLSSVAVGADVVIPVSVTVADTVFVTSGATIVTGDGYSLKYTYAQTRDCEGFIIAYNYSQKVKLAEDEDFQPGDINTAVSYVWEHNRPIAQMIYGGHYMAAYEYQYDAEGYLSKEVSCGFDSAEWDAVTEYEYLKFDDKGNWLERVATCKSSGSENITRHKRLITYY